MLHNADILVVGFGHMGQALVEGAIAKGVSPHRLHVIDPSPQAAKAAARLQVRLLTGPKQVSPVPDIVLLAVKPQIMEDVVAEYRPFVRPQTVFISIAAGVSTQRLQLMLSPGARIVRAMPNTPAAVGAGVTVLCHAGDIAMEQMALAETLMGCVGDVSWLEDESLMDAVTAISGSGPAYAFLLMEAMAQAGKKLGLEADLARKLATKTVQGAGQLACARAEDQTPAQLRKAVTSPGGTTEAALNVLMKDDILQHLVEKAATAARDKGVELNKISL